MPIARIAATTHMRAVQRMLRPANATPLFNFVKLINGPGLVRLVNGEPSALLRLGSAAPNFSTLFEHAMSGFAPPRATVLSE